MRRVLLTLCSALAFAIPAQAQKYPQQPVKIVVPFAAGGATDIIARLVAARLSVRLDQPFVVENRGGASGITGTLAVKQAKPDGYTLLLSGNGPHATNAVLFQKLPYDPLKDFTQISLTGKLPLVLNVNPSIPVQSLAGFFTWVKASADPVSYASPGNGSPPHLTMELLAQTQGLSMLHVPYKGSAGAISDLIAGHVPVMFDNVLASISNVQSGRIRALAVASAERLSGMPSVPTFKEAGLPEFDVATWTLLAAPAGTPRPIVDLLSREIQQIFAEPDIQSRLQQQGVVPTTMTPDQTQRYVAEEIHKWGQVVRRAKIAPLDQ